MSMCMNARCDGKSYLCGKCRKMYPLLAQSMAEEKRKSRERNRSNGRRRNNGGWTPRTHGTMEDGREVTFRQGTGDNEGHTLIADGHKSDRQFRKGHNHYGPKREGGGRVDDDRGHYKGRGR